MCGRDSIAIPARAGAGNNWRPGAAEYHDAVLPHVHSPVEMVVGLSGSQRRVVTNVEAHMPWLEPEESGFVEVSGRRVWYRMNGIEHADAVPFW